MTRLITVLLVGALMMGSSASAQTLYHTETVVTPSPTITIPIPSNLGGSHLRIRVIGSSDAPHDHVSVGLQINGDQGQNYGWAWDSAIGGVPPTTSWSSGGDDEARARVGLVPGAALQVPHAAGEVEIFIPHYRGTDFIRLIRFDGGETLGITRSIRVSGHATYYAGRFDWGSGGNGGGGGGTTGGTIQLGSTAAGQDNTSTGLAWNHTVASGENMLVVGFSHTDPADATLQGFTRNGQSFTKINSVRRADGVAWTSLWYLANPTVGTYAIQPQLSASVRHAGASESFVDMAAPSASAVSAVSGAQSVTMAVGTTGAWAVLAGQSAAPSAGSNVVQRQLLPTFGQFQGDTGGALSAGTVTLAMNGIDNGTAVAAVFPPGTVSGGGGGGGGAPATGGNYGTGGSYTAPAPVDSVTILLDVGNWIAGSIVQIYIEP